MLPIRLFAICIAVSTVLGFCPSQQFITKKSLRVQSSRKLVVDQSIIDIASVPGVIESISDNVLQTMPSAEGAMSFVPEASNLLSFVDQGQNLAGIFFQASLLPYLAFLYFLSFRANRIPDLGNFGFQFVLLFVVSTIPSGIVSKAVYGNSLADVDWLHGGAELLLTIANILIVLGFREASTKAAPSVSVDTGRKVAFGAFILFAAACALGPSIGFESHSAFLFGAGDLDRGVVNGLPWVTHSEPANALSVPTWAIHFSSVIEYLIAMGYVWKYAEVTGNPKWKGLTWGMLPLHASGICACTYHFFYNPSVLQFLVTMQAGFTLLGNLTCAIAAYRIAVSNGWSFDEVNPLPKSSTNPRGLVADGIASMPLTLTEAEESDQILVAKVVAMTLFLSYFIKYAELGIDIPFQPNGPLALATVLGIPAITAYQFYKQSPDLSLDGTGSKLGSVVSMEDIKKYGVSGTVAYVLTELAFWIVAFPVAAYALYQTNGQWPDVVNNSGDRAAVLAFIFAGANIARALVPLRIGAALALAPWVDENILKNEPADESS